jgi:hypothetical protein
MMHRELSLCVEGALLLLLIVRHNMRSREHVLTQNIACTSTTFID